MEYFKSLQALLKIERDEDFKQFKELTERIPISSRRANGLSWYPVAIRNTEMTRGDYMNVEFERTTHHEVSHQFRFGSAVALFSNHDSAERVEGTVTQVSGSKCKITFRVDELPNWIRDGKLGLDLLFDNNSYNEMTNALKSADEGSKDPKSTTNNLVTLFTGIRQPGFQNQGYNYPLPMLNDLQQQAVHKIVAAEDLAIVHGPPGTGKTTTLVQAIKALLKKDNQQILVVAPSNTAVDLLTEKLAEIEINVLRIGNPARVSARLQSLTMESKTANHEDTKDIKSLKKQASEYKNMAHKYKRNFGRAEQEQRKALFNEAYKIMKEVEKHEKYISDEVIAKAQVITATLVSANHYTIRHLNFNTVVIDEAGQALEPACWIPILKAKKVIFAGDHCQLPPTIKSNAAAKLGLGVTLMEKSVAKFPEAVILLEEQYRMHNDIMGFSSKVFYHNLLKANQSVASATLLQNEPAFSFIDTSGCGFDEKNESTSISNIEEANFLLKHLNAYLEQLAPNFGENDFPSVGVISPYQEQIKTILSIRDDFNTVSQHVTSITFNTIDSFQGQERDVIYISLTRSNAERNIGFLADIRRMNVAITRAKKKLVIIGDGTTLSKSKFYKDLINYAVDRNSYFSAWEFLV